MKFDEKKNRFFALLFIVMWAVVTIVNMVLPIQTFSESENRMLKQFPSYSTRRLLEGDFMDDMNEYISDQFLGRQFWVQSHSFLSYVIGMREINGIYITRNNGLFKHYSPENIKISAANAEGLSAFAQDSGIPTYVMLVPSSSSVLSDRLPAFAQSWDEETYIKSFYSELDPAVTPIPVFDILREHSDDYIYYRTDHHWTTYGAYWGYREIAAALGFSAKEIDDFTITVLTDSFEGTYDSAAQIDLSDKDIMELYESGSATHYVVNNGSSEVAYDTIYFQEYLAKKDKYSYLLGTVQPIVTITTNAQTDKKLLLFKDSYAHCLTPMLLSDYSEIKLVDLRYYMPLSSWMQDLDVASYDQALFLFSTDVFGHQRISSKLA